MILTLDFGTSVTKVALWADDGLVAMARAGLATSHPQVGWAEQDPLSWWTSVVVGCAEARAVAPEAFAAVDVIACSAARQTFVPVTAGGEPLGPGLLWSDRRAPAEAAALTESLGGEDAARQRTGMPVDSGAVAAKLAWILAHQPGRLEASAWILSPRDLVLWRLTGELATDVTLASRTGLLTAAGEPVPELAGPVLRRLPPVVPPDRVIGTLRPVPAAELGLRAGIPVVIGAGDRQCEVLGAGATVARPMVSWGTTANVSVPVAARPDPVPRGAVVSRDATGGWLVEGGLSSAGSFLSWLGSVTGTEPERLAELAADSPPGARGVVAVPWLDGARAPWWRDQARGALVGLASAHHTGDMARAVIEAVAWDVARCLEAIVPAGGPPGTPAGGPSGTPSGASTGIPAGASTGTPPGLEGLTLGGVGSTMPLWVEVLTSVTGLPATRRRSGEAASAGAALLAARALGSALALDAMDPVTVQAVPAPAAVARYQDLERAAHRVATTLIELGLEGEAPPAAPGPDSPGPDSPGPDTPAEPG